MMHEQEMQFADPDWKPTGPLSAQSANTAANQVPVSGGGQGSNQPYSAMGPDNLPAYDQGYRPSWQGQPFSMQPSPVTQQVPYQSANAMRGRGRGRSRWWIWVIIAIIFLSMMSGTFHTFNHGSSYGYANPQQQMPAQRSQAYDMLGATQVNINDLSGNVIVQVAGDGAQSVVVNTDDGSQPQVVYEGTRMTITANDSGDITVTIPQNVALHLSGGQNNIEVDGFAGQLTAQTDSAPIILNSDQLSAGSSLNTNSGNIDLEQGSMSDTSITSSTGTVTLNQVDLSGQVTVSTGGNGTISYTGGALDPQGKYQFTTDSGAIALTLSKDTSAQVSVAQKSGNYHSDFPKKSGNPPQASVVITTNSGDITITQQ